MSSELPPEPLRHTLSLVSSFSMSLRFLSLFHSPFPVESGCKSTTLFHSTKIFFRFPPNFFSPGLNIIALQKKKNFQISPKPRTKSMKNVLFGLKLASIQSRKRQNTRYKLIYSFLHCFKKPNKHIYTSFSAD